MYKELNSTSPKDMLTLNKVFKFSKPEHFQNALPRNNVAQQYSHEVCQLISLLLKKFDYGFQYQKGAIFGFGEKKSDDTGTFLKLCDLDDEKINQLNQVRIHNLSEEWSFGLVNYELDNCGKQNLEYVSRKMILNKSTDLIIKNLSDFRKYWKPAVEIKELKFQWNQKMKESTFSQKLLVLTLNTRNFMI